MHVVVVRDGDDAVLALGARAAGRTRSCRRACATRRPRRSASVGTASRSRGAHGEHFAKLVVRERWRRASRGAPACPRCRSSADVEVAARRGLVERRERDLDELRRRPSAFAISSAISTSRPRTRPDSAGRPRRRARRLPRRRPTQRRRLLSRFRPRRDRKRGGEQGRERHEPCGRSRRGVDPGMRHRAILCAPDSPAKPWRTVHQNRASPATIRPRGAHRRGEMTPSKGWE